jgi:hypothetical protein
MDTDSTGCAEFAVSAPWPGDDWPELRDVAGLKRAGLAESTVSVEVRRWLVQPSSRRRLADVAVLIELHASGTAALPEAAALAARAADLSALARRPLTGGPPTAAGVGGAVGLRPVFERLVDQLARIVFVVAGWDPAEVGWAEHSAPAAGRAPHWGASVDDRQRALAAAVVGRLPDHWLDHVVVDVAHQLLGGTATPHEGSCSASLYAHVARAVLAGPPSQTPTDNPDATATAAVSPCVEPRRVWTWGSAPKPQDGTDSGRRPRWALDASDKIDLLAETDRARRHVGPRT